MIPYYAYWFRLKLINKPTTLKHLNPIFKRAKTMETERLIKKVKALKSKKDSEAELADLEAQRQLLAVSHSHHSPVGRDWTYGIAPLSRPHTVPTALDQSSQTPSVQAEPYPTAFDRYRYSHSRDYLIRPRGSQKGRKSNMQFESRC